MTAGDIVTAALAHLHDSDGLRYLAADLLGYLNDGMQVLYSRRPDCVVLETDVIIRIQAPPSAAGSIEVLGVHEKFRQVLVDYVLWQAYSLDTDEAEATNKGGLAAFHRSAFERGAATL